MTCDQSTELLPWLLNGTLEAAEREEVLHHLATCDRCREALTETRESWSTFDQHIPSQDLVALAWSERPSGIDPALAEAHLASCPQCAAEIELVRMSRRLEEEDNVALFPAVKPRAAIATVATAAAAPRAWRAAAIAASLSAVVAASGWIYTAQQANRLPGTPESALVSAASASEKIAQLEKEREILARPQAADIVELDAVVRAGEAGEGATVRAGVYSTLLLPAQGAAGPGAAEILDESGKVVLRVGGLPQKLGYYSLVLPPRALEPGRYTLRLSGLDEARAFPVVP